MSSIVVVVDGNEGGEKMNNSPKYPSDFFDFTDGVDIPEEEINQWIAEMIQKLRDNPDWPYTGTSTGNTCVLVSRDGDGNNFEVMVTKSYSRAFVYE
jgi:hypothetical protein